MVFDASYKKQGHRHFGCRFSSRIYSFPTLRGTWHDPSSPQVFPLSSDPPSSLLAGLASPSTSCAAAARIRAGLRPPTPPPLTLWGPSRLRRHQAPSASSSSLRTPASLPGSWRPSLAGTASGSTAWPSSSTCCWGKGTSYSTSWI
jgi:hypothetical protein